MPDWTIQQSDGGSIFQLNNYDSVYPEFSVYTPLENALRLPQPAPFDQFQEVMEQRGLRAAPPSPPQVPELLNQFVPLWLVLLLFGVAMLFTTVWTGCPRLPAALRDGSIV